MASQKWIHQEKIAVPIYVGVSVASLKIVWVLIDS